MSKLPDSAFTRQKLRRLQLLCIDLSTQLQLLIPSLNRRLATRCLPVVQSLQALSDSVTPPNKQPSQSARDYLSQTVAAIQPDHSADSRRLQASLHNVMNAIEDISNMWLSPISGDDLGAELETLARLRAARQMGLQALERGVGCTTKCKLRKEVREAAADLWADGKDVRATTRFFFALKQWSVCVGDSPTARAWVKQGIDFVKEWTREEDEREFPPMGSACRTDAILREEGRSYREGRDSVDSVECTGCTGRGSGKRSGRESSRSSVQAKDGSTGVHSETTTGEHQDGCNEGTLRYSNKTLKRQVSSEESDESSFRQHSLRKP